MERMLFLNSLLLNLNSVPLLYFLDNEVLFPPQTALRFLSWCPKGGPWVRIFVSRCNTPPPQVVLFRRQPGNASTIMLLFSTLFILPCFSELKNGIFIIFSRFLLRTSEEICLHMEIMPVTCSQQSVLQFHFISVVMDLCLFIHLL